MAYDKFLCKVHWLYLVGRKNAKGVGRVYHLKFARGHRCVCFSFLKKFNGKIFPKLSLVGRDIALYIYIYGGGVQTSVIPFMHLKYIISTY
jgi:hypothetical protein